MIRYRNGAYEVQVYVGLDPVTGKERKVSRSLRMPERKRIPAEVLTLEAKLRTQIDNGAHAGPRVTVGELLDRWLAHIREDRSPLTIHGYDRCIRLYLKPALGPVRLDKLTTARLDGLYRALRAGGGVEGKALAPATIRQAHAIIRRSLTQAQRWGWIDRNVAALAEPPSVKRTEKAAPTLAEIRRLIAAARTPELALLIALAAGTGARRGEVCGLRWSDVDLEAREVVIRRAAIEIGHKVSVKDTKSGKVRRVPIGRKLVAALKARHAEQAAMALRAGASFTDGFVLSESLDASTPLHPNLASDRFRVLARTLTLPIRLHDLRHAAATNALASGAAVNDVAAHLGHASAKMTLDVYGHAIPAGQRRIADALDVG